MAIPDLNITALLGFIALATASNIALIIVVGMFPFSARPESAQSISASVLIFCDVILLSALLIGTILFGYDQLRWHILIIVSGLVFLFSPGLFELLPTTLRDTPIGLFTLAAVLVGSLALLASVQRTTPSILLSF